MKAACSFLLLCIAIFAVANADARGGMGGGMMGGGSTGLGGSLGSGSSTGLPGVLGADGKYYDDFKPTGLTPEFPKNLGCRSVLALFGSPSTSDGLDLDISGSAHLLSIAEGEVIALGTGSAKEGNYLWLRFPPEATGQTFWTFAKYQHLQSVPKLEIGSHIGAGEVIPFSNGPEAIVNQKGDARPVSAVHISASYGPSPEFRLGGRWQSVVKAKDAKVGDPIILFVHNIGMPETANDLPLEKKRVTVAVAGIDQKIYPPSGIMPCT